MAKHYTYGNLSFLIDEEGKLTVISGDAGVTLTGNDVREIREAYDREIYFREDVMQEIETSIEEGYLPKSAEKNSAFVEAILEEYNRLRQENDGDSEGMNWRACMDEAFGSVLYANYVRKNELTGDSLAEFVGQNVDLFEDYCSEKGIDIRNPEKAEFAEEQGIEPDSEEDNAAIIFGSDYDKIGDKVRYYIQEYDLFSNRISEKFAKTVAASIVDVFVEILSSRGTNKGIEDDGVELSCLEIINLVDKVVEAFRRWHLVEEE